ncbi:hypothetical protein NKR19_g4023 [Coniochaeta hoffmannii]|uniref:Uncharacterized protein n=1 Tax=Coniochaeta hoffmannii TaxID=91930 RepID=A0AA38RUI8_9PEZI|nr:hypothetical protein NKR19_g4023 [Coniochaeta hoffmannii]
MTPSRAPLNRLTIPAPRAQTTTRRPLSSTAARLTTTGSPDPNKPASFSLKQQLGGSPRARAVVYTGIAALALVEGAWYYNFVPKVLGWEEKKEKNEQAQ